MEFKEKNSKKYTRRNNFSDSHREAENSKCNINYQNSLISRILKKNENLKFINISDKSNINNIDNIKNNIKNIFSTDESKSKAIKYIIKTRKEKRELSPCYKLNNQDLFPLKEKLRENTPNKSNNFYVQDNCNDKDEISNKISVYNKRNILQMPSSDKILKESDDLNFGNLNRNKKQFKSFKKYNKRKIIKEENEMKSHFTYFNIKDEKILNNNIKLTSKINNNENKSIKKEEEKNCINISFSEEGNFGNFIQNRKNDKFNLYNTTDNLNEEGNNKLLITNSHEISFRSFKNGNDYSSYNSQNNSLDIKDFKTDNNGNKKQLLLEKTLENSVTIFNNKNYKYKFETEKEIINYLKSKNIQMDEKPISFIYIEELNNIKKENNDNKIEIAELNNKKELYLKEIIRLQKENGLLRQKLKEVYNAYQENYNICASLKQENEKNKLISKIMNLNNDFIQESNVNFKICGVTSMKVMDKNNNDIINDKLNQDISQNKIDEYFYIFNYNNKEKYIKEEKTKKELKEKKNNSKLILSNEEKKDNKMNYEVLNKAMPKLMKIFNEKTKKQDKYFE